MEFHIKGGGCLLDKIHKRVSEVDKIKIICGFASDSGLSQLIKKIGEYDFEKKIDYFLVGLLTSDSFNAFKERNQFFTRQDMFWVGTKLMLSSTIPSGLNIKGLPMVHAKLMIGKKDGNIEWAYIGSANMTEFALKDKNFEGSIFIDSDPSNSKILNDIEKYMEYIKINNSKIFDPLHIYPIFKPTEDGEYTFKLDSPYEEIGPLYLVTVLSRLKETDFGVHDKDLFDSDLITETKFSRDMETIHQPILFLFIEDIDFLSSGKYFIKPGTIVMSNDEKGGRLQPRSGTLGYINHKKSFPFFWIRGKKSIIQSNKSSQVSFKVFKNLDDMEKEVKMRNDTRQFIDDIIAGNRSIADIVIKTKCTIPSDKNSNDPYIINIESLNNSTVINETFESVYYSIIKPGDNGKINYDSFHLDSIEEMQKEKLDEYLEGQIIQLELDGIRKFPWVIKVNKILKRS